jgi:uncharacterized membrane protein YoaK (UPF0700 family)
MIHKLPRWVAAGGFVLAAIAGLINVVGLLGFQHQGITHMTGTTTMLGIAVAEGDRAEIGHWVSVVLSFFAGAVLSGFIIRDSTLQLGRRYGVALLVESGLLLLAIPLLSRQIGSGDYLAACACGLQNAMASTYSGALLRTTHVSGLVTDLGVQMGHLLRGVPVDWKKVKLWSFLLAGFLGGGVLGTVLYKTFAYRALYLPVAITGLCGAGYIVYRHLVRHRAEAKTVA